MAELPSAQDVELRPARINERFIAYVIDVAPFMAVYTACALLLASKLPPQARELAGPALLAVYLLYQFLGNLTGGTIGKRMMGITVVRKDGTPLGFARSVVRALGTLLSTPLFNFGFVVALLHPESRALHDLISGSVVVEPRSKTPAEAVILFLAAIMTMAAMYAGILYLNVYRPTPKELLAVEKAGEGLVVMAQVQEAYKEAHGSYTNSLADLAETSGDAAGFRQSMSQIFIENQFKIEAGNKGYRISGVARDRRRTRVTVAGPPPALLP